MEKYLLITSICNVIFLLIFIKILMEIKKAIEGLQKTSNNFLGNLGL